MISKTVIQEIEVQRKKPVNLIPEDGKLFKEEFSRFLPEVKLHTFRDVYVDYNGTIFKRFSVYIHSSRIKINLYFFLQSIIKRKKKIVHPLLVIHDDWYFGYFHWIADSLTKLVALRNITKKFILLMPKELNSYQVDSLMAFNFVEIKYIDKNELFRASELTTIDLIAPTGNYNPKIVNDLRATFTKFCSKFKIQKLISENLFVSRSRALSRNFENEKEIQFLLEKYNFQTIHFEDYSFYEQISIMKNCKIIISLHGSGLTNIIFGSENLNVVEIRVKNDCLNNCYFSLASALNQKYYYLLADEYQKGNLHLDYIYLDTFLEQYFNDKK